MENKELEPKKAVTWNSSTIEKSLRIYLACGSSGYEILRDQGLPLPAIRTLQSRIQNFKFDAGILEDAFPLLEMKVIHLTTDCMFYIANTIFFAYNSDGTIFGL